MCARLTLGFFRKAVLMFDTSGQTLPEPWEPDYGITDEAVPVAICLVCGDEVPTVDDSLCPDCDQERSEQ